MPATAGDQNAVQRHCDQDTPCQGVDPELQADFYKFDLRRTNGKLLWREDNHEGHEAEHGGPHHLHIGPEENHRVAVAPRTLLEVAEKVVTTHISRI
jgi:hypothetical protein